MRFTPMDLGKAEVTDLDSGATILKNNLCLDSFWMLKCRKFKQQKFYMNCRILLLTRRNEWNHAAGYADVKKAQISDSKWPPVNLSSLVCEQVVQIAAHFACSTLVSLVEYSSRGPSTKPYIWLTESTNHQGTTFLYNLQLWHSYRGVHVYQN